MTALTVRLPNSVHETIKELAKRDGISVNQFIASAAAEKMASFLTVEHLKREAAKGSRKDFEKFLRKVPSVPPLPGDEREESTGSAPACCQDPLPPTVAGRTRPLSQPPSRLPPCREQRDRTPHHQLQLAL